MSPKRQALLDYLSITAGAAVTAVALALFLVPNKIAAGGVSGLGTIFHHITQWPVGRIILSLNVPLFLIGFKELGMQSGIRSLYAVFVLSLLTDLITPFVTSPTSDPLLAALYGGVVGGLGMGLVFRARGTTGGTDIIARLIEKYSNFSAGKGLVMVDIVVIAFAGITFSAELALYAFVSLFLVGRMIDFVQEGLNVSKAAIIISDRSTEIQRSILYNLKRGVTILNGRGAYTGMDKEVLLCIIGRSELTQLKRIVQNEDPSGFIIISNVHDVLGEGFQDPRLPKKVLK